MISLRRRVSYDGDWLSSVDWSPLTKTTLYMLSDTVGPLSALSPRPAHMTRGDLSDCRLRYLFSLTSCNYTPSCCWSSEIHIKTL